MTGKRLAGHALLWTGFLSGAFVSVRSTEIADRPWSTISWPLYGLALAVAIAGVVVLRMTQTGEDTSEEKHASNIAGLESLLQKVLGQVKQWQTEAGKLPVFEVHQAIDRELADDLAEFAELRQALVRAFGLQHYARVMTDFALAERAINRMWSASADGYVDEVEACVDRAVGHLESALQKLEDARQAA